MQVVYHDASGEMLFPNDVQSVSFLLNFINTLQCEYAVDILL